MDALPEVWILTAPGVMAGHATVHGVFASEESAHSPCGLYPVAKTCNGVTVPAR